MLKARNEYYHHLALYYKNKAKLKRCVAAVHLEADVDKIFWQKVFQRLLPGYSFDYITYSRTAEGNKATGCTTCLKYYRLGCLSDKFFICIDSDYRYLMQEDDIDANHFIFQTYTYSLENHYCYPDNIKRALNRLGAGESIPDFGSFLKRYSQVLYELFLYHLFSVSKNDRVFTYKDFKKHMTFNSFSRPDEENILAFLQQQAELRLSTLRNIYPDVSLSRLRQRFEKLGLREDNAYLYFRGHNVLEQVVVKLMEEVCKKQSSEEKARRSTDKKKLMETLMEELNFGQYPEIKKIENDVKKIFKTKTS